MKITRSIIALLSILLIAFSPNLTYGEANSESPNLEQNEQENGEIINNEPNNSAQDKVGDVTTDSEENNENIETIDTIKTDEEKDQEKDELEKEKQITQQSKILANENPSSDAVVFKYKDKSSEVKDLKLNLMKIGFGTHWKNPTDYYGPDTVKVVKEFQTYYSLEVNGNIDEQSLAKLNEVLESPYQRGKRSQEVLELKQKLMRAGYGTHWKNPTNYYGPDTEKVVRQFQQENKLVENGILDSVTLQKLESLLKEIQEKGFSKGMRSAEIQKLKLDLMKAGFGTHWKNPTTYFGPDTEKVVKEFQTYYSIPVNGALDSTTQSKLSEILSSPYQRGNRSNEIQEIKYKLMNVGFGTHWNVPSTLYGPDTEKVVREFQKNNRLVVNGIIDEVTKQRLEDMLENGFRKGMSSPLVKDYKLDLMKAGFGTHWKNPTNYYGSDTEKVVKDFQSYYSLTVDGTLNAETLQKLNDVLDSPYQRGKRSNEIKDLKIDLMKLGFGTHWKNPSTLFGPDTENIVKEFQREYKLAVNGILDEVTLEKINELLEQGYSYGDRSQEVIELKQRLKKAGFGTHWENPSNYYGPDTVKVVKEFQAYYSLPVDGEMRLGSLKKLDEILSSSYQRGKRSSQIKQIKEKLKIIGFGRHWNPPTNYYGPETESVVREFQETYGLVVNGIIDEVTLAKINELMKTNRYVKYNITLKQALEMQMKTDPKTDKKYAYVHTNYIKNNKVTAKNGLNVRLGPGTKYKKIATLPNGTEVNIIGKSGDFYAIEYNPKDWVIALENDVLYYLNPLHFERDLKQKFQFLDLSRLSGATTKVLNDYLKDKGVLNNKGSVFIQAGNENGINELYLLSHALLETGNGKSLLASGNIRVGKISDKKYVVVLPDNGGTFIVDNGNITKNNNFNLNGITLRKTYNMFGIGAVDRNPNILGAVRAFEEGWTSVDKAILGGAKFIGKGYVQAGQNTLYKMRWNPQAMVNLGYATHQYATDIGWASKQVGNIYNLYQAIGINTYYFEIPVYK